MHIFHLKQKVSIIHLRIIFQDGYVAPLMFNLHAKIDSKYDKSVLHSTECYCYCLIVLHHLYNYIYIDIYVCQL